jgi:hypothetical protein
VHARQALDHLTTELPPYSSLLTLLWALPYSIPFILLPLMSLKHGKCVPISEPWKSSWSRILFFYLSSLIIPFSPSDLYSNITFIEGFLDHLLKILSIFSPHLPKVTITSFSFSLALDSYLKLFVCIFVLYLCE